MNQVVGIAIVLLVALCVYAGAHWIAAHYVESPRPDPPRGEFHNPGYRQKAQSALEKFARLPVAEQNVLRRNLEQNIVAIDTWLGWLRASDYKMLCLGENHEDTTRQFLAEQFFSQIDFDVLALEATPHQLGLIEQELRWGRERVLLLGADIAGIIRAARGLEPDIQLIAIEETKSQRVARREPDVRGTRDESIQSNFWGYYRYGHRYVILFGALHCQNKDGWLFDGIHRRAPRRVAAEMINVRAVEVHQEGPVEALAYFLDAIGIHQENFVVIDSKAVHPLIYEWFELLEMMLKDFSVLMVFGNGPEIADG